MPPVTFNPDTVKNNIAQIVQLSRDIVMTLDQNRSDWSSGPNHDQFQAGYDFSKQIQDMYPKYENKLNLGTLVGSGTGGGSGGSSGSGGSGGSSTRSH